ncbi:MAG: threonine synthase [Balneola sp.]
METQLATNSLIKNLHCSSCGKEYSAYDLADYAHCCDKPLLIEYHLNSSFKKEMLIGRPLTMWRYHEMLPVLNPANRVSLGEGMTPILDLNRVGDEYGFENLSLKDEGLNPTGSFKSRGLSMAVSKAKEFGVEECVIPTAGNAGGAMSAYCARAGIKATVIMPDITPKIFQDEYKYYGAEVILVNGLIDKCGHIAKELAERTGAFNMSTLKEPYRIEGKKTMGYEIAEQLNWKLPDVIVYPTGGGTGLIGIWKAFKEMVQLGWLEANKLPKMVVVQTENCAPMVSYVNGDKIDESQFRKSIANGLAVPKAFGQDLIKEVVEESGGYALAVDEQRILEGTLEIGRKEGISIAPEGGAIWEAVKQLKAEEKVMGGDKILLLNTGNALKYLENLEL